MYYLSHEETKWLSRHLIPMVREVGVAEELRGWNWHQPPLQPPYDVRLPVYEIAGKYCPSGRDIYLKRVLGAESAPGESALAGALYHSVVAQVMSEAKRLIYRHGPREVPRIADSLRAFVPQLGNEGTTRDNRGGVPRASSSAETEESRSESSGEAETSGIPGAGVMRQVRSLSSFEIERVVAGMGDVLSRQPYIGADSLAALVVPVTCEYRLDGSFLGLSSLVCCDAAAIGGTIVYDLKFGRKRDFHRLSVTGYALVMESLWDLPVDVGCTVYADLRGEVPSIARDLYAIDDELRQWFVDERDDKMRIVAEGLDPGLPSECYRYCGYQEHCTEHPSTESRVTAGSR